ncbi:MAG: hypothetical protein ACE5GW_02340 [Planctomycetota bacterium]
MILRFLLCVFVIGLTAGPLQADFIRGDANDDGGVDLADVISSLSWLFIPGTPEPACMDALDGNDDGLVNISDPVYVATFLFISGSPPPPPYPDPGPDPTADPLGDCGGGVTPLPWEILEVGQLSGFPQPCEMTLYTLAFRAQAEWQAFWDAHTSIFLPPPPLPDVNFAINSVIVIMQSAPTGGYGVSLGAIFEFDDHIEVDLTLQDPAGCAVPMICSAPHIMVLVPALQTDGDVIPNVVTEFPCL